MPCLDETASASILELGDGSGVWTMLFISTADDGTGAPNVVTEPTPCMIMTMIDSEK
jgi:hypothetical protein